MALKVFLVLCVDHFWVERAFEKKFKFEFFQKFKNYLIFKKSQNFESTKVSRKLKFHVEVFWRFNFKFLESSKSRFWQFDLNFFEKIQDFKTFSSVSSFSKVPWSRSQNCKFKSLKILKILFNFMNFLLASSLRCNPWVAFMGRQCITVQSWVCLKVNGNCKTRNSLASHANMFPCCKTSSRVKCE